MAALVLPSDTLLSTLLPSGGGNLASGDTIDFNGHTLVMDCDAVDYPFTPTNAGGLCNLELRDGSRIRINASLPSTVSPWVDPEHPLPARNTRAGLTANASAEIQLNGSFSLGGGEANLPTEQIAGNWWAKVVAWSGSTATIDRPVDFVPGDLVQDYTYETNMQIPVTSYNPNTLEVTLASAPGSRSIGSPISRMSGGVMINRVSGTGDTISANIFFGTLNIIERGSDNWTAFFNNVSAAGSMLMARGNDFNARSLAKGYVHADIDNLGAFYFDSLNGDIDIVANIKSKNALFRKMGGNSRAGTIKNCIIHLDGGAITDTPVIRRMDFVAKNYLMPALPTLQYAKNNIVRLVDCTVGSSHVADTQYEPEGTVSRVARSDFPTDTDLPDAFYFAPATASDVPWRYEDYWVRKGETLRLSCRAMRGGDNGTARVAIGEMAVWVPAAGMPTLAEWVLDSGEPLVWRGGQIAWTNDTDEDCQVRVWSMASGIHGAYIRVWRATGGAL